MSEDSITDQFPIGPISELASREARARMHHRPVYTMHRYWARRPGSVFRAIIKQTLGCADGTTAVSDGGTIPDCALDGAFDDLWQTQLVDSDFGDKTVLDPFMGGGTTLVEGRRLNCNVVGADVNPVAWFIVKKSLEDVDLDALDAAMDSLRESVGQQIREYYETTCPECDGVADGIAYLWVRQCSCPRCETSISLFNDYYFAEARSSNHDFVHTVCPECWALGTAQEDSDSFRCGGCGSTHAIDGGPLDFGSAECPSCASSFRVMDVAESGPIPAKMYAISYHCASCESRGYKRPDQGDRERYRDAEQRCEELWEKLPIPTQRRYFGSSDRAYAHGFSHFHQMFNERQLLSLGELLHEISGVESSNVQEFLLLAFSAAIETNNMFCTYNRAGNKVEPIFNYPTITTRLTPVENNVWGGRVGRGSFESMVDKVRSGKEWCQQPIERYLGADGSTGSVRTQRPVSAQFASDPDELGEDANVFLQCGSADSLPLDDDSVDAVVTDPPYYDYRMYGELSDFFYVWLRQILNERYDMFEAVRTPKREEAVVDPERNVEFERTEDHYVSLLGDIFGEAVRVLKPDGLVVFTFHHSSLEAWRALVSALDAAGLVVTKIHQVESEARGGTRVETSGGNLDAVIVCEPEGRALESGSVAEIREIVLQEALDQIQAIVENGYSLTEEEMRQITIATYIEVWSRYDVDRGLWETLEE